MAIIEIHCIWDTFVYDDKENANIQMFRLMHVDSEKKVALPLSEEKTKIIILTITVFSSHKQRGKELFLFVSLC